MRKEFEFFLYNEMSSNKDIVLITADLGYGLWDRIKKDSSEQLMLGIACGLSMEGKLPVCYSITPFLIYRPFEWIRNYLDHEKINVKLVGGGRDRDYGYLGFSHWAEEDIKILSSFKNINTFKPSKLSNSVLSEFLYSKAPSYINLKR